MRFSGFPRLLENPAKSWIFFLEISRTWNVLENHFGSGKSWKLKFRVLESPGKNILENYASLKSPTSLALNLVS